MLRGSGAAPFHAMVTDLNMPRMDGFELARVMRSDARLKSVPIIMITSRAGGSYRDSLNKC